MSTDQECELGAEKHGTAREHAGDVKTASPDGWRGMETLPTTGGPFEFMNAADPSKRVQAGRWEDGSLMMSEFFFVERGGKVFLTPLATHWRLPSPPSPEPTT
jgi:hypothetical protein